MHTPNQLAQPFVFLLATAGLAFPPGVLPAHRNLQHSTEQGHCTPFPLLFYAGALRFGSCVKIAIAFLNLPLLAQVSFSRRNRRISSSVAFRRPGPGNAASPSCLAFRTHCLSSPSDSPHSRSTSASGLPLLAASSIAKRLNSQLYVRRVLLIVIIASIRSVKDLSLPPLKRGNIMRRLGRSQSPDEDSLSSDPATFLGLLTAFGLPLSQSPDEDSLSSDSLCNRIRTTSLFLRLNPLTRIHCLPTATNSSIWK